MFNMTLYLILSLPQSQTAKITSIRFLSGVARTLEMSKSIPTVKDVVK